MAEEGVCLAGEGGMCGWGGEHAWPRRGHTWLGRGCAWQVGGAHPTGMLARLIRSYIL